MGSYKIYKLIKTVNMTGFSTCDLLQFCVIPYNSQKLE